MIVSTFKHWRGIGAVAALGLAACGGEAGPEHGENGEAGESGASAPAPSSETAVAPANGEQGEAGAVSAYSGLSGDQLTALRLQHLKGFVFAAQAMAEGDRPEDAGVLVAQGLLEVYDSASDQFGALDIARVRAAADGAGLTRAQMMGKLNAASAAIDTAAQGLHIDHAVLAARMTDIAAGLYQGVIQADFVDAIEYQHSHGAALAARDALAKGEAELRRRDGRAFSDAQTEIAKFVALWPSAEAPATPSPYRDVLAQSSRVRLALSPYL